MKVQVHQLPNDFMNANQRSQKQTMEYCTSRLHIYVSNRTWTVTLGNDKMSMGCCIIGSIPGKETTVAAIGAAIGSTGVADKGMAVMKCCCCCCCWGTIAIGGVAAVAGIPCRAKVTAGTFWQVTALTDCGLLEVGRRKGG